MWRRRTLILLRLGTLDSIARLDAARSQSLVTCLHAFFDGRPASLVMGEFRRIEANGAKVTV